MKLVTVGLNHKTAPLEVREKLAFSPEKLKEALRLLMGNLHTEESMILSTCNRVEVYSATQHPSKTISEIKNFLSHFHATPLSLLDSHFYHHVHLDAVLHGFRVASGLDSMVLGESQILGQMKEAYQVAS